MQQVQLKHRHQLVETERSTSASAEKSATPAERPTPTAKAPNKRRRILILAAIVVGIVLLVFGIPQIIRAFNTVSTDDAYVNGYVTFVAPRVSGQVAHVLVDNNNRVKKGDVLVQLDPEPYQVQVAIKQAAVDAAQASLTVAQANVRGILGQTRSNRFKLQRSIEDVDNQIALIAARVATWEQEKAALVLAQQEFDRAQRLLSTRVVSQEEYDERREALDAAKAQVTQALQNIYQARVALGLPAQVPEGKTLADVPDDLDQTFSSVRQAQADLLQTAAQLGIVPSSYTLSPKQMLDEFYRRDPSGDLDRIFAEVIKNAPSLKQAQTNLLQAQRDLDQANLNLRYCTVVAEIDGVISRRNLNPGNNLQAGQSVMAINSLRDIWIDANFKETQLRNLRIGQHVDLELDTYGKKHIFEGRISGFTYGTGSTLALLPAQNATGNFVKVVQRLPVRIDVLNYDPEKLPLFAGLSVTPTVDLTSTPAGPNAGQYLQEREQPATSASPTP
ncbi:MAG: HlyD family secretion protein [Verrucomicrobia bacterium]|nr:HlyD family secretion protein [Verrucomicrobiota bacterium]MBV8279188.1 HlyD family secretion protein [Verrucomicrobiota bacterium]